MFTSSATKTIGSKAVSANTNAALRGVEKGAPKPSTMWLIKWPAPENAECPLNSPMVNQQTAENPAEQPDLRGGIATNHDFVQRYK